jgi:hypothetical protein
MVLGLAIGIAFCSVTHPHRGERLLGEVYVVAVLDRDVLERGKDIHHPHNASGYELVHSVDVHDVMH